ncbi:MAG: hypothetical protein NT062_18495, partial [Proteobacteria bacterium]|nr:hypothetical protein [Pseudomonadota bacterium]
MRRLAVLAVSGCLSAAPIPPNQGSSTTDSRTDWIEVPSPPVVRLSTAIVPSELGDPGVEARLGYRTQLARSGKVWLKLDTRPSRDKLQSNERGKPIPVVEETRTHLRIVIDDDGARWLAWIARDDAKLVPAATVQLADRVGRAHARAGVWLDPGAAITLIGEPIGEPSGRRREVAVVDRSVEASGWVRVTALAEVYPVTAPRALPADAPRLRLDAQTVIRVAPDPGAAEVARTLDALAVAPSAPPTGAWREVELVRPFGRVHGFVPVRALHVDDDLGTIGLGGGHGFGMSNAVFKKLAVGACLFDGASGDVIGVNL